MGGITLYPEDYGVCCVLGKVPECGAVFNIVGQRFAYLANSVLYGMVADGHVRRKKFVTLPPTIRLLGSMMFYCVTARKHHIDTLSPCRRLVRSTESPTLNGG